MIPLGWGRVGILAWWAHRLPTRYSPGVDWFFDPRVRIGFGIGTGEVGAAFEFPNTKGMAEEDGEAQSADSLTGDARLGSKRSDVNLLGF
jgi:hypothetical protein